MKIFRAEDCHFSSIQSFVEPFEFSCILLSSYIRKKSKNIYVIYDDKITGIVYFDKTLLHCIPEIERYQNQLTQLFVDFFADKTVKCIDGEKKGTDFFLKILHQCENQPYQVNHYRLMINKTINLPPEKLSADDEIRRCTYPDLESIFDLQKAYISSEVAPLGKKVTDSEITLGLKQILKNQLCLAVFADDKAVCKANTNALGIKWIQIGGVYTHPQFRRNYYAWHLIGSLCKRISKAGKNTALFVKDINVPAITLYKKIGFEDAGQFEIAYF